LAGRRFERGKISHETRRVGIGAALKVGTRWRRIEFLFANPGRASRSRLLMKVATTGELATHPGFEAMNFTAAGLVRTKGAV